MAESTAELNELFATPNTTIQQDVLGELQSILRIHSLSSQELFFKWEAYSLKMGFENTRMDYKTSRDFKKDLQDALERDSRGKAHLQSANKRTINATPRNANTGDVFGVLDGMVSNTPASRMKRRNNYDTPSGKASKLNETSSPAEQRTPNIETKADTQPTATVSFADRPNPGQIVEQLNGHILLPDTQSERPAEPRVRLKANTELAKFAYKPMAMKLSEASEILDDRIDEFTELVKQHHGFPESAFGNPAAESTSEIIAVGRIASDTSEGKLNAASMVLETSRRMGAGLRIPLRMEKLPFDFFPGKIVALKGINASGEHFTVSEVLSLPHLSLPATSTAEWDIHNERLSGSESISDARPLNILTGSGPYTTESDLSYDALHEICDKAASTVADVLILTGPFLDLEHPLVAAGDFQLPPDAKVNPETATISDVFRTLISAPLNRLIQQVPFITIILVPSVRDAVSKHVSWPQDRFMRKELGLMKQVTCVTNPIMISINEILFGISTEDVLYEMQRQRVSSGGVFSSDTMAALSANVIDQRHFFPVFPPLPRAENTPTIGASLDIAYLKLGELLNVVPDVMVLPSALTPFVKVVEGVMVVNPGLASKKRGAGTFAQVVVKAKEITDEEREAERKLPHLLYERARVDIVRV